MTKGNVLNQVESNDAFSFDAWVKSLIVGEYQDIRIKVCVRCDWSVNKWQNKLSGKTKFTRLEKIAINEIAGKKVFNV